MRNKFFIDTFLGTPCMLLYMLRVNSISNNTTRDCRISVTQEALGKKDDRLSNGL